MLNCTAMCRSMDKKPCGNILKSLLESVFKADATLKRYMGGGIMQQSTTTGSNPVISIMKGRNEKTQGNLAVNSKPASVAEQFAITSDDGSAVIAGYKPGKPLPLCRVTGTE